MTIGTLANRLVCTAMDDSNHAAHPARESREVLTAYCGVRTCGMHPEHLYTGDDGDAVRCPGGQQH